MINMFNKILEYFFRILISGIINFIMNAPIIFLILYFVSEYKKNKDLKWMKINMCLRKIGKVTAAFFFCFGIFLKMIFRKK